MIKVPVFFLKGGHWGQRGWKRVPWYLWLIKCSDYTNKVRWIKFKGIDLFPKTRQRIHDYFLHRRAAARARKYAEKLEKQIQEREEEQYD